MAVSRYLYIAGYKECEDKRAFIVSQSKNWKRAHVIVSIVDKIRRSMIEEFNNEEEIIQYYHEYCMN